MKKFDRVSDTGCHDDELLQASSLLCEAAAGRPAADVTECYHLTREQLTSWTVVEA